MNVNVAQSRHRGASSQLDLPAASPRKNAPEYGGVKNGRADRAALNLGEGHRLRLQHEREDADRLADPNSRGRS